MPFMGCPCVSMMNEKWLLKEVLRNAIYKQFLLDFRQRCPSNLYRVSSCSFLKHVIDPKPAFICWNVVASHIGLPFIANLSSYGSKALSDLLLSFAKGVDLIRAIIEFRTSTKQTLTVSLRQVSSWNLNGWNSFGQKNDRKKSIVNRLIRRGPVCIQETKWVDYGGIQQLGLDSTVISSNSLETQCGGRSGGVAIFVPLNFEVKSWIEILPGKIIAAKLHTRTSEFWIVSIYLHPNSRVHDLSSLREWLIKTDDSIPKFLAGDFNNVHCDGDGRNWEAVLNNNDLEDLCEDIQTFVHPHGLSCLDKIIAPADPIQKGYSSFNIYLEQQFVLQGHFIVKACFNHRASVEDSPDHPIHNTIPTDVFIQKSRNVHENNMSNFSAINIDRLVSKLFAIPNPNLWNLQGAIWSWWTSCCIISIVFLTCISFKGTLTIPL